MFWTLWRNGKFTIRTSYFLNRNVLNSMAESTVYDKYIIFFESEFSELYGGIDSLRQGHHIFWIGILWTLWRNEQFAIRMLCFYKPHVTPPAGTHSAMKTKGISNLKYQKLRFKKIKTKSVPSTAHLQVFIVQAVCSAGPQTRIQSLIYYNKNATYFFTAAAASARILFSYSSIAAFVRILKLPAAAPPFW